MRLRLNEQHHLQMGLPLPMNLWQSTAFPQRVPSASCVSQSFDLPVVPITQQVASAQGYLCELLNSAEHIDVELVDCSGIHNVGDTVFESSCPFAAQWLVSTHLDVPSCRTQSCSCVMPVTGLHHQGRHLLPSGTTNWNTICVFFIDGKLNTSFRYAVSISKPPLPKRRDSLSSSHGLTP